MVTEWWHCFRSQHDRTFRDLLPESPVECWVQSFLLQPAGAHGMIEQLTTPDEVRKNPAVIEAYLGVEHETKQEV